MLTSKVVHRHNRSIAATNSVNRKIYR